MRFRGIQVVLHQSFTLSLFLCLDAVLRLHDDYMTINMGRKARGFSTRRSGVRVMSLWARFILFVKSFKRSGLKFSILARYEKNAFQWIPPDKSVLRHISLTAYEMRILRNDATG